MELEIEVGMLKAKVHYLEQMLEATINKLSDHNQPERSKREDTVIFKRFPALFDPRDPESVRKAQECMIDAYSDAVL